VPSSPTPIPTPAAVQDLKLIVALFDPGELRPARTLVTTGLGLLQDGVSNADRSIKLHKADVASAGLLDFCKGGGPFGGTPKKEKKKGKKLKKRKNRPFLEL